MRDSRNRWVFLKHESRPVLDAADVVYWKGALKKILKVGAEFEFNLPDQKGGCKGNNPCCPCVSINTGCWTTCVKKSVCEMPACDGVYCPDFETACIGCEKFKIKCDGCKERFDPSKNPNEIRSRIQEELRPSLCYGIVGTGVHSITRDGSLLGDKGMEVVTVGRRVDYWEFYSMVKSIMDKAVSKGAYMNERCSTHMHLLASYYGKTNKQKREDDAENLEIPGVPTNISEMEKDMPEIIMANFHQLCRRYQNAVTWMTIALDNPKHMTRWEKFRVSVLPISAVLNTMPNVQATVRHNSACGNPHGNKYGWVNYELCSFTPAGNVKRFHVEMRAADGILCPSAIAAMACLYYALAVKAVEISRYGILEVEDKEWLDKSLQIKEAMMNNMKDYNAGDRFSDTSNLHKYYDVLREESLDLCRQLKHILIKTGPAYNVLECLAQKPIALRRCEGEDWEKIEKDIEVPRTEETRFETKVNEYIDMRLIDECKTISEWVVAVSSAIKEEFSAADENIETKVRDYIESKRNDGDLIWSDKLGTVVSI